MSNQHGEVNSQVFIPASFYKKAEKVLIANNCSRESLSKLVYDNQLRSVALNLFKLSQNPQDKPTAKASSVLYEDQRITQKSAISDLSQTQGSTVKRTKVGYMLNPFAQCCIPLSKTNARTWKRVNGTSFLTLSATHPDFGLPDGGDRRLIYWLATQKILRQDSIDPHCIPFSGIRHTLEELGMTVQGKNRDALCKSILTLHHTAMNWTVGNPIKGGHSKNEFIISELRGLLTDLDIKGFSRTGQNLTGEIHLGHTFFSATAFPIDWDLLLKLKNKWLAIDLYVWISERLFRKDFPRNPIPLDSLRHQLGFSDDKLMKNIRQDLKNAIRELLSINFLGAPEFSKDGNSLILPRVKLPELSAARN